MLILKDIKNAKQVCKFDNMTIKSYKYVRFMNEENSLLIKEITKKDEDRKLKIKMNVSAFEKVEELKKKKILKQKKEEKY